MAAERADLERVCVEAAKAIGFDTLKDHQLQVITGFVGGRDVFGALPTGYGKSLCFTLLPSIFNLLLGRDDSVVIIITPLTSIIHDQVSVSCNVLV